MATNAVVGGKVRCGSDAAAGAAVKLTLLNDNRRATRYSATTTTDANGAYAVAFDVDAADVASLPLAKIEVRCPNGTTRVFLTRLEFSQAGAASLTLRAMIVNIGTELLSRVIGAPIITPILSTDFVFLAGDARSIDCCPPGTGGDGGGTTGGSSGGGGSGGSGTGGNAGDAARRAEEAARRAEEAARRAERARQRAREERRRAEEERRRAEAERQRAAEERRRAAAERRRAEAARRAAEAALAEARRLNQRRTRVCFDLKGRATQTGRAGVTVAGESVVVDVAPGDSAEAVLGRIAASLRFRGFEVVGPRQDPGTGEFVICVISDAAGDDPTGGGLGTIDVRGFERSSAKKQVYRPALARGDPPAQGARLALGPRNRLSSLQTIELQLSSTGSERPDVMRIALDHVKQPEDLIDLLGATLPGLVVAINEQEGDALMLDLASIDDAGFSVDGIAVEASPDADSGFAVAVESPVPQLPPADPQGKGGKRRKA